MTVSQPIEWMHAINQVDVGILSTSFLYAAMISPLVHAVQTMMDVVVVREEECIQDHLTQQRGSSLFPLEEEPGITDHSM